MKKYLPEKFRSIKMPSLLTDAVQRKEKLLPASLPKSAAQLPIPKTPFDHYQRGKLIQLLKFGQYVGGRSVLEVGCGIGDLLLEMHKFHPKELYGVDSTAASIEFATQYLKDIDVDLSVASAASLPFPDNSFDVVLVMYELQHIDQDRMMKRVVHEVARVARHWVILVEETAQESYRHENIIRRTVDDYQDAFKYVDGSRFFLRNTEYLHVNASRYIFTGANNPWHWIRWVFSPLFYLMGFPSSWMKIPLGETDLPESKIALFLQKWSLPFTANLDNIYKSNDGTTAMWFEREKLFGRG